MAQSPTEEAESPVVAQATAAEALHSPEHWAQLAEVHEEGDQDDGYSVLDPDSAETTASITSSILQYRTIHGRTFHSERGDAQYWAANDEQNSDSLDIGKSSTLERELTFEPNSIDFIHMRYLFGSISDWKELFGEAYKACKPGGWVESCECSPKMESDDGTVKDGSAMNEWGRLFVQGAKRIGRFFTVLEEGIQEKYMHEAGFVDIQVKNIKVPIGGWPKDETLKEAGRFAQLALERDLEGYTCYIASQFLGWSREEISVYCAQLRRELHNGKVHAFYRQKVVFGRKSEAA
ncbi:demethylmenaquinone methyltransferase [Fusarium albosuccineum]|uniref:Demethylmenaquinone methyltransferase n=1 Tax=Fusarium albosuccineum TaxID=1237068 RepID=A0A8H4L2S2_9HYPO|nr:demethylmenaquinone methyltransferase [Fusarium albosuccineum]